MKSAGLRPARGVRVGPKQMDEARQPQRLCVKTEQAEEKEEVNK